MNPITARFDAQQSDRLVSLMQECGVKAAQSITEIGAGGTAIDRIFKNAGDFERKVIKLIMDHALENMQVECDSGYPSDYRPKGVMEQMKILQRIFPGIGSANKDLLAQIEKGEMQLPWCAEAFFAIPHWSKVARTYQSAVEKIVHLLDDTYDGMFRNMVGDSTIEETSKKATAMRALERSQNADVLIVPAQFGKNYAGLAAWSSINRMKVSDDEFGLGLYEVGIMILTHTNRFAGNDLWIDCVGDEVLPTDKESPLVRAPFMAFADGRLQVGLNGLSDTGGNYGAASGCILHLS